MKQRHLITYMCLLGLGCMVSSATLAENTKGDWNISNQGGSSISGSAVAGEFCRDAPTTLDITCEGGNVAITIVSGCEPSMRSNREANILFTHEFKDLSDAIFDTSSVYPFQVQPDDRTLIYSDEYTVQLLAKMAKYPTLGIGIALRGQHRLAPTSHFETGGLAQAIRETGMQCGIGDLLE